MKNLETKRFNLILRTQADLLDVTKMSFDELLRRFNFSTEKEVENERSRSLRLLDRNPEEYILWDIQEKNTLGNIGNLGFHNLLMHHKRSEVGYWCDKEWRRKGVISEALEEVIKFGFEELKLNRIEAFLDKDNFASEMVLLKRGFVQEGVLREHYIDHDKVCDSYVYSLIRSDYY